MSTEATSRARVDSVVMSEADEARVRRQLEEHAWYREVLETYRRRVEELIARAPEIPVAKGMAFHEACPDDRAPLVFDPYAPRRHVCPLCGKDWQGTAFDLAWVRQFQDWLAKRLVEAGILYRLERDERHARLVRDALTHFVARYHDYPLANDLLGPTRLFQSTYLEAFWLVDIVAAYDLTRSSPAYGEADHAGVEGLLYESAATVMSFDEGASNRQAFDNAGVGAVALLYRDDAMLGHVLEGPHGFAFHMRESLLEDGIWYEGETYHFATLDHSLDLAEMALRRGIDLYAGSSGYGSLRPMFDGPLKVMLPDLTFPSRKDSWFGRGVGYHKAVYELGYARYGDERYGGLLARAYAAGEPRTDLSWRTFLNLEPVLPDVPEEDLRPTSSERMPGTGLAVLRRDGGRTCASLEYGRYGGGHGHPDRLHLNLYADGVQWLLDPGTGWYHVKELAWYRSTLAHNAVMVDASNQDQASGELTAFGETASFAAAQARVAGAYPGTTMRRSLCLGDGFLLDVCEVEAGGLADAAGREVGGRESAGGGGSGGRAGVPGGEVPGDAAEPTIDWTCNVRGEVRFSLGAEGAGEAEARPLGAPLAARGGHQFLDATAEVIGPGGREGLGAGEAPGGGRATGPDRAGAGAVLDVRFADEGRSLRLLQAAPERVFRGRALGIPLREDRPFTTVISRRCGARARFASAWVWGDAASTARLDGEALAVGEDRYALVLDDGPGLGVARLRAGRLAGLAWFGRREVAVADGRGAVVRAACDRRLERAGLAWEEGRLAVDLDPGFGRVVLAGPGLPNTGEVVGLPPGATWRAEAGVLVLEQAPGVAVWAAEEHAVDAAEQHAVGASRWAAPGGARVAAGAVTELRFVVARYGAGDGTRGGQGTSVKGRGDPDAAAPADDPGPRLELPRGWALEGLARAGGDGVVETWTAAVRVPGDADAGVPGDAGREAEVGVLVGGGRHALPVTVVRPVSVAWGVVAAEGSPRLRLALRDQAGSAGRVWGEVIAPWLSPAPRTFVLGLEPHGEAEVDIGLPLAPRPATPPEPPERLARVGVEIPAGPVAEPGDNTGRLAEGGAGDYHVAAVVSRGGFRGVSAWRFPLAWALREGEALAAGMAEPGAAGVPCGAGLRLDRAEQAYWAETPWGGPEDASAVATLTWDERGLRLRCLVTDDVHVSDANAEDLYENDSLQVYFDFRPPSRQDSTFAPGVAGYVLAPDADRRGVRVEAIAGSRELANRDLAADWFTVDGVVATAAPVGELGGYRLEAYFPYSSLGVRPLRPGDVFRADLSLSDNDGSWYRTRQLVWSGARGYRRCYLRWAYLDPAGYGWVVVA